jgi:nicotinamidase-related amidase
MPLSAIDPRSALVVIDLQKGVVSLPTAPHAADTIVERSARLAQAYRKRGLPVVLVNVAGRAPGRTDEEPRQFTPPADWSELVPELDRQPDDVLVTKQRWGAFLGTTLDAELKQRGVTQLVFTGIATSIGVESSARSAYDLGYHVVLVTDAMTDLNADAHRRSIETVFPRMGEIATTDDVLARLAS